MPELVTSLNDKDLGHLLILGELWSIELDAPDADSALPILVSEMLDPENQQELLELLPDEAREALAVIHAKGGQLSWSVFSHKYGDIREMGPARRDREAPHRDPESIAEILWYRGLIGRAFFDTPSGPDEFVYIPTDLNDMVASLSEQFPVPEMQEASPNLPGRPATLPEKQERTPASDRILDDACTLLAARRMGNPIPDFPTSEAFIDTLLTQEGILLEDGQPETEAAREFLEAPRAQAILQLVQTWLNSEKINDLQDIPHLMLEGEWSNQPRDTRELLVSVITSIPGNTWWSISSLTSYIQQTHPDFQRSAGEYDAWFVRDIRTDSFVRGYDHWDEVEGALVRYLVRGPLHWLGILDLAFPSTDPDEIETQPEETAPSAFRLSELATPLLNSSLPENLPEENPEIHVKTDGRVQVSRETPRDVRYQVSRFCSWVEETEYEYRYRLTPGALAQAREQGLLIKHLLSMLAKYAEGTPPNILDALSRWDESGLAARVQHPAVLRLGNPEVLDALQESRGARFLGDALGPVSVIVKPGAEEKILAVLVELGYFGELENPDS